jgi:hypothetical protein
MRPTRQAMHWMVTRTVPSPQSKKWNGVGAEPPTVDLKKKSLSPILKITGKLVVPKPFSEQSSEVGRD